MSDLRNHTNASLGIRNNNPGNLRTGISWKGAIGANKGFAVFDTVEHGIRAMATDIRTKLNKGKNTLDSYIPIYAPPSENDTTAYINRVSDSTGFAPNEKLSPDPMTLFKLVKAHIRVENGNDANLISDKMIQDGISLMGGGTIPKAAIGVGIIFVIAAIIVIMYLKK